jgi:hypothetical protein
MVPYHISLYSQAQSFCPSSVLIILLTNHKIPPPLISLPPELLCDILRKLPIKKDYNLLLSYREIYDNSKYTFDQKCFRVIPLTLEHESISQTKDFTKEQPYCFLEEIIIRIDQECNRYPGKLHLENRLLSLFINIF